MENRMDTKKPILKSRLALTHCHHYKNVPPLRTVLYPVHIAKTLLRAGAGLRAGRHSLNRTKRREGHFLKNDDRKYRNAGYWGAFKRLLWRECPRST